MPLFRRILIANRGEIALRVIRTAREMGIETVAIYSDADRAALHVRKATRGVHLGGNAPAESYLDHEKVLAAAKSAGCDALHPGYGFLSENAAFAEACEEAGITFLGPPAAAIRSMGDKVAARRIALEAGVPLVPGLQDDVDEAGLLAAAEQVGYPVMLKAAAGGGGKGIRIVEDESGLVEAYRMATAEAKGAFGDDRVYLEKFVVEPRHVEIQVMADKHGNVVHYGERECSVQRRHQKLVAGSASVSVSGGSLPYTYLWSNGATSAAINNVPAGTYTISEETKSFLTGTWTKMRWTNLSMKHLNSSNSIILCFPCLKKTSRLSQMNKKKR